MRCVKLLRVELEAGGDYAARIRDADALVQIIRSGAGDAVAVRRPAARGARDVAGLAVESAIGVFCLGAAADAGVAVDMEEREVAIRVAADAIGRASVAGGALGVACLAHHARITVAAVGADSPAYRAVKVG